MPGKPSLPSPAPRKAVLVIDDHPIMREGLAQLINHEPDLCVSAHAENAAQAMAAIAHQRPDLVLADISLPGKSGLELIKDLQALDPELPVLVLSMHDESLYAERVLRAGGRGYIMKQEGGEKLMAAIRQVLAGKISVSEKLSARILEAFSGRRAQANVSPLERLTDREFEVFALIGQGKSSRQIAQQLHLSVKTVEVHRVHIKQKLSIQTATELMHFAVRWQESQAPG
jgi:DNA-binding NarL/FixJ family response regulator